MKSDQKSNGEQMVSLKTESTYNYIKKHFPNLEDSEIQNLMDEENSS